MYLSKLKLENFRNYENQELNLINGINLFLGDNAQGKTNIIEAIYICAFGKSYRTLKDNELIMFGKEYCRINLDYIKNDNNFNTSFFIDICLVYAEWEDTGCRRTKFQNEILIDRNRTIWYYFDKEQ